MTTEWALRRPASQSDSDLATLRPNTAELKSRLVNRYRDRYANLHRWLVAITGSDLHWDNPRLNDALLETSNWLIGPIIAIDAARLSADND